MKNARGAELCKKVLSFAAGFACEVYMINSGEETAEASGGGIENVLRKETTGISIRVFKPGRQGFSYTTDLSTGGLERAAKDAIENCAYSGRDDNYAIPEPAEDTGAAVPVEVYDKSFSSVGMGVLEKTAMAMHDSALRYSPEIKRVFKSSAAKMEYEVFIESSRGVSKVQRGTLFSAGLEVVAERGEETQSGGEFGIKRFHGDLNAEEIAVIACRRALELLGAKKLKSMSIPVVLEPQVTAEFLGLVAEGLFADNVMRKKSVFASRLGQNVAAPCVTVIDDGTLPGGTGTEGFDAEGIPMKKKTLIENGNLKNFLHNDYTSRAMGTKSTGNAVRSLKEAPCVGISNFYMLPGRTERKELSAGAECMIVSGVIGMHTANPISGDFSVGINGTYFKNGEPLGPVSGMTMAGNIRDFLSNIEMAADDLTFYAGVGAPSVRIKKMTLSGD